MTELTRQEFAVAVNEAIGAVRHLYREVDQLLQGLRDELAAADSLKPVRATIGKSGRNPYRLTVRFEYGALFELSDDTEADLEDEDAADEGEGDEEVDGDHGAPGHKTRARLELSDQPLLCVRIVLHQAVATTSFEPTIEWAVMDQWKVGGNLIKPGTTVPLKSNMLRRIPLSLGDRSSSAPGTTLATAAVARVPRRSGAKGGRAISCRLPRGVETVPLFDLQGADHLRQLASRMSQMWRSAGMGA